MKKQLLLFVLMLLPMVTMADASGKCGDNLTWNYSEIIQNLYIDGSGEMYDYSSGSAPWYRYRAKIKKVYLHDVTNIGNYAFYGLKEATHILIRETLSSIGRGAFYGCSKLTFINIPNNVISIGDHAFFNCKSLTSIPIPNSLTTISNETFVWCTGLTSVTIPNSVTSIGDEAFYGCSGLTSITFGNSVINIGNWTFSSCSGLTSITIPNSVTSIGDGAFSGCSGLNSVTIPNSVTSIGDGAFADCSGCTSMIVESVNSKFDSRNNCNAIIETATNKLIAGCKNTVIPDNVTSIGYRAFEGCSGLISVTIPNSVTSIGDRAFKGCSDLKSITIGSGVTSIGNDAFADCPGFTSVTLNSNDIVSKTYSEYSTNIKNIFGDQVTEYIIGNDVTSIGSYAFYDCSKITSVTIGNNVTDIGEKAFCWCSSLTSVTVLNPTPVAIIPSTFTYRRNAILYVPKGSKAAYKAADNWKEFKEIVEIDTGIDQIINDENNGTVVYTFDGKLMGGPQKGLNIIRISNGKTLKVVAK